MKPRTLVLLAPLFLLLLVSRKPDALLHAELWGDEGWSFYPDAYRLGVGCLLIPAGGYLDSFQRLVGLAVQPLPLTAVPTVFALVALLVQTLPALFLLSDRMGVAIPDRRLRLVLALLLLCVPNALELHGNLTNSQWNLALLSLLIVIGTPATHRIGQGFDLVVLAISGLSGPFMLMLAPVALWQARVLRDRSSRLRLAMVVATALIQLAVLATQPHGGRSAAPLGAGPRMLAQVLGAQVILGAEIGRNSAGLVQQLALWRDNLLPLLLMAAAILVTILALRSGPLALRQAALFVGLMLAASLVSPQVSLDRPRWEIMTHMPMGNRYFAYPVMLWIVLLVRLAADRRPWSRTLGLALLLPVLVWAIPHDWSVMPMGHTDFVRRARLFEAAPPGTRMQFPIVPSGLTPMELVRKPD